MLQWFLVFNGSNRSGAGAKNLLRLEPEPKILDVSSRSPKFEFRLHSPDFNSVNRHIYNVTQTVSWVLKPVREHARGPWMWCKGL